MGWGTSPPHPASAGTLVDQGLAELPWGWVADECTQTPFAGGRCGFLTHLCMNKDVLSTEHPQQQETCSPR